MGDRKMTAPIQPPPMDPWAPGVRAADVPIAEGNPLEDETTAADAGIDTHKCTFRRSR
jgi:hypothetical protein